MSKRENGLTHFDARGQARMVDVATKAETHRIAIARGRTCHRSLGGGYGGALEQPGGEQRLGQRQGEREPARLAQQAKSVSDTGACAAVIFPRPGDGQPRVLQRTPRRLRPGRIRLPLSAASTFA